MFQVIATSNNKTYTKQFKTYMDAYLYAGQLPHYLAQDATIAIVDDCTGNICGMWTSVVGWSSTPVLAP